MTKKFKCFVILVVISRAEAAERLLLDRDGCRSSEAGRGASVVRFGRGRGPRRCQEALRLRMKKLVDMRRVRKETGTGSKAGGDCRRNRGGRKQRGGGEVI